MKKVIKLQPYIDKRNKRVESIKKDIENFFDETFNQPGQMDEILDMIRNRPQNYNDTQNKDN